MIFLNAIRGFLIGIAEVVPGVSGGTVALIVGIYERVVVSAAKSSRAVLSILRGRGRAAMQLLKEVDWLLLLPLIVGMIPAIFLSSVILENLLTTQPENMRGLFAGMILASLYVPYRLASSNWTLKDYLLAVLAAGGAFIFTSLPKSAQGNPELWMVFFAAALAVCALALPGISGSFLLLILGFYGPTIAAVSNLNIPYLTVFLAGAIVGLGSFSNLLQWLFKNHHRVTMTLMTGLMAGSLRALWPWQGSEGQLLTPDDFSPGLFVGLGFIVVVLMLIFERRLQSQQ